MARIVIGIGLGFSRRSAGAPAPPAVTPATIMGANCLDWWRADLGVTVATGVSQWVGQQNGLVFSQATGAAQPALQAAGGPNGTASILFDGANDAMTGPLLARSGNQTIWLVARQTAWVSADSIINDASATLILIQRTASPNLGMSRGTPGNNNANATIDTYRRIQAEFTASVADTLRVGATVAAGTNTGSTAGTQPLLGRNAASSTFGAFEICDLSLFDAIPSAGQLADLDSYALARYGAGVLA